MNIIKTKKKKQIYIYTHAYTYIIPETHTQNKTNV